MMVPFQGVSLPSVSGSPMDDYVEVGLLLPKNRAVALMEMARDRRETIGQLLRKMVDKAITESKLN